MEKTNKSKLGGLLAGLAVNLVCCAVFCVAAQRLTKISPLSTFVLSYAPLIQGALIAVPVAGSFKAVRVKRAVPGLAAGLLLGTLLQFGSFFVWHAHWVQAYAG